MKLKSVPKEEGQMTERTLKNLVGGLEGNMNYILRAFTDGRIKSEHLPDIIKSWAMCYKQSILMEMADKIMSNKDPERYATMIPMVAFKTLPELTKNSEQLNNMMENLIEGCKEEREALRGKTTDQANQGTKTGRATSSEPVFEEVDKAKTEA